MRSILILLAVIAVSTAWISHAQEKTEYLDQRYSLPDSYPGYPLLNFDVERGSTQLSFMRIENQDEKFDVRTVPAGKQLGVRGFWFSHDLIEAYRRKYNQQKNTFYRGADSPEYDEILESFRSKDPNQLPTMLARLAELRKRPRSEDEKKRVSKARAAAKAKGRSLPPFDEEFIGSGMIEVDDPAVKEDDPAKNTRRFIPISLFEAGKVKLDPVSSRIIVLKSILMTILEDSSALLQHAELPVLSKMSTAISEIGCKDSPCSSQSEVFAKAVEATMMLGMKDNASAIDIMDQNYDKKLKRAEISKLQGILKKLKQLCFP